MIEICIWKEDGTRDERHFNLASVVIGRGPNCDLKFDNQHLSTEHAKIFIENNTVVFKDLNSTNGTQLLRNDVRSPIDETRNWEVPLELGDRLLLGPQETPVVIEVLIPPPTNIEEIATVAVAELVTPPLDQKQADSLLASLRALSKTSEVDEALSCLSKACLDLFPLSNNVAIFLRKERDEDRFVVVDAISRNTNGAEAMLPSKTVLKRVLKDRVALLFANALEDFNASASVVASNITSIIATPLWDDDEILGIVQIDNRGGSGMFSERDLRLATLVASHASLVVEKVILLQRLKIAEASLQEENLYLKSKDSSLGFNDIIADSPPMKAVISQLEKVVNTRATVCIQGETGTGKELVARAIHNESKRSQKMFVAQNCAALPEPLLESELFGHVKGAFTGAATAKKGLFDLADGGTLFLDEIGEMPPSLQAKVLRVLQEGQLRPVGAMNEHQVDVRIVCATHRDLTKEVEAGNFRQDLFYRLMVFPIELPALRQRGDDIVALANFFLQKYSREYHRTLQGITMEAMAALKAYTWPGNVRELENEVQRLIIQAVESWVDVADLSPKILSVKPRVSRDGRTLKETMVEFEKELLREALVQSNGNKTKAAQSLGITREGFHKKLSKYGIK